MLFDFVSSVVHQSEQRVSIEMARENNSLRADIEVCNEKIAFYEAEIIENDRESAKIAAEVEMLLNKYAYFNSCMIKLKRRYQSSYFFVFFFRFIPPHEVPRICQTKLQKSRTKHQRMVAFWQNMKMKRTSTSMTWKR